jgi:hypothetical protein
MDDINHDMELEEVDAIINWMRNGLLAQAQW